jgi:hypothetical protein
VDLELPNADRGFAPAVDSHEGPAVEAGLGSVQSPPVQQGRSGTPGRGQVYLEITSSARSQRDFRL